MEDKSKGITIHFTGEIAEQLKELQKKLKAESEIKVIRMALAMLITSLGKKVEIKDEDKKEKYEIDSLKSAKPLEE